MGVTEGVDVEHVDVGRSEENVLDELFRLEDMDIGRAAILTEVNMCQGSMKMNEARNHIT